MQRIWTIPNALSATRIALTPLVGYLVLSEQPVRAIFLLAFCGLSDLADGWIARRYHQSSALGSVLDPLGDKLLVGTLALALWWGPGELPGWLLLLIVGRDVALMGFTAVSRWQSLHSSAPQLPITLKRFLDPSVATVVITPTLLSKINTALQLLLLGCSLTSVALDSSGGGSTSLLGEILWSLQWLVAGTTVGSAVDYFINYRRSIRFIKR